MDVKTRMVAIKNDDDTSALLVNDSLAINGDPNGGANHMLQMKGGSIIELDTNNADIIKLQLEYTTNLAFKYNRQEDIQHNISIEGVYIPTKSYIARCE
jgi:hypothetical protein